MLKKRLIACLIIREGLIVQSIAYKQFLPIGTPRFPIEFVAKWDVDEIILLDISATSEDRTIYPEIIEQVSRYCFVPLTVGGGIKSVDDIRRLTRAGADKVVINSHAIAKPTLLSEAADKFGSQCIVLSMDCRRQQNGEYQVYTHGGKKKSNLSPEMWSKQAENLGAGEIFLNSIDRDGSKKGYDIELIRRVTQSVSIPVIACGGVGSYRHFSPGIIEGGASAVAAANIFHFIEHSTIIAKAHMLRSGIDVRCDNNATYGSHEFDDVGRLFMLSNQQLSEINS